MRLILLFALAAILLFCFLSVSCAGSRTEQGWNDAHTQFVSLLAERTALRRAARP